MGLKILGTKPLVPLESIPPWMKMCKREIRKDEEAYGSQIDFFVRKEKIKSKVSI